MNSASTGVRFVGCVDDAIKPLLSYSMCSSFVEFHIHRVLPDPRVLWMLGLFDCEGFISDIRGNRTCKIQPVKGHREVLSY